MVMIVGGEIEKEKSTERRLMGPDRSKSLHNFTLPCSLKWGNQKILRCRKVDSDFVADRRFPAAVPEVDTSSIDRFPCRSSSERDRLTDRSKGTLPASFPAFGSFNQMPKAERDGGIEAVREKLMFDLQTAADKMKDAIFRDGVEEKPQSAAALSNAADAEAAASKPWNLRTRRAACKAPSGAWNGVGGANPYKAEAAPRPNASPARAERSKSPMPATAAAAPSSPGKRERADLSVSLSKQEIEEDFLTMAGRRPPRRPKKRTRNIQKELDFLSPGLYLSEINADSYKVVDASDPVKR